MKYAVIEVTEKINLADGEKLSSDNLLEFEFNQNPPNESTEDDIKMYETVEEAERALDKCSASYISDKDGVLLTTYQIAELSDNGLEWGNIIKITPFEIVHSAKSESVEKTSKFEIMTDSCEIKKELKDYIVGDGYAQFTEQRVIESFDSKEEALKALKKYNSSASAFKSPGGNYIDCREFWVEENIYDSTDGELLESTGAVKFAPMEKHARTIKKEHFSR